MEALLFDRAAIPSAVQQALCGLLFLSSMEVLAAKLLHGLVAGDAVTAVENEMQYSRKTTNNDFLRTLLAVWLRLSPQAHVGTLLENVGAVDSSVAATCCEIAAIDISTLGTSFLPIPEDRQLDISFYAREDIVYRCFMEYTRCAVPPTCHLPISSISKILAKLQFRVSGWHSRSYCYTLQHVLKHHSDDVTSVFIDMSGGFKTWHWSLYNQALKSTILTHLQVKTTVMAMSSFHVCQRMRQ